MLARLVSKLLTSSDPPTSASSDVKITGVSYHAWPSDKFLSLEFILYFEKQADNTYMHIYQVARLLYVILRVYIILFLYL